jgi:tripartite-type tricarboxylate transporter receptor subunit TctC
MREEVVIRRFLVAAACVLGLVQATAATAQSWPDKPVKLVVPFPPGGPIDTMGRLVAHNLSQSLGQQVVVENKPGAGSTIGTKSVAIADPDGYTLLFGSSGSLAVAPALYGDFDVDPRKAFVTVATVALLPHVFVVAPAVPARTVAEFIAYAKANPGKLNYGAGLGTPPHLLGTLFKVKAGLDVVYVPYKGSAASITDLLGGQTHMTIDGLTGLYPLIRDGKVRPLAVARPTRWAELPDVPTLAESGFPDFVIDAWTGVVAPAGTPPQVVAKLNAAINDGLQTSETKASLAKFSAIAKVGTPQEFAGFLAYEMVKWAEVVRLAGARID